MIYIIFGLVYFLLRIELYIYQKNIEKYLETQKTLIDIWMKSITNLVSEIYLTENESNDSESDGK